MFLIKLARLLLKSPIDFLNFWTGLKEQQKKGTNSNQSYLSMINLFCLTGGKSNTLFSKPTKRKYPKYSIKYSNGKNILQNSVNQLDKINQILNKDGFHIFKETLPEKYRVGLMNYALTEKAIITETNKETGASTRVRKVYERDNPTAVIYNFPSVELLQAEVVQDIIADETILSIAQEYLGCQPILDYTAMWWSTTFSDLPDKEAAQYYHFDMDRIKWIKFFFYITDVSSTNGPHTFIRGSQADNGIPLSLRVKGYKRLNDEDIRRNFKPADIIEMTATKGTIIAEDTRGLHKGKNVQEGERLIFQVQYTNSLFGTKLPNFKLNNIKSQTLEKCLQKYPRTFSTIQV